MAELQACKGTQFDGRMVDAMIEAVRAEGWVPAVAPTADELRGQDAVTTYDDDDPMLAPRMYR